jgi:hypothetical protein
MRGFVCIITVIGSLALPFGLLGADRTSQDATKADRRLAAKIKKEVAKDDSLPPSSRNVEVTVQNRIVTLKGTVQSDEESQAILGDAESVAINVTPDRLINSIEFRFDNQLVATQH